MQIQRKRFVGIDGYCYSSTQNYQIIYPILNKDNIYQKYVRVIKRIYLFMKKRKIKKDNTRIRKNIFQNFSDRIEKFCIDNFKILDVSLFYDIFNRLMFDIYYRLNIIK